MEKIAKPAKKLVLQFPTTIINVSLKKKKFIQTSAGPTATQSKVQEKNKQT
jgi:hypothetical protein